MSDPENDNSKTESQTPELDLRPVRNPDQSKTVWRPSIILRQQKVKRAWEIVRQMEEDKEHFK